MARYHGEVGFGGDAVEITPSVWEHPITVRTYHGDITRDTNTFTTDADEVLGDVNVSNAISILADEYAIEHFHEIKFVKWGGVYYVVTNVQYVRPRLTLNIGGVYNGPKA